MNAKIKYLIVPIAAGVGLFSFLFLPIMTGFRNVTFFETLNNAPGEYVFFAFLAILSAIGAIVGGSLRIKLLAGIASAAATGFLFILLGVLSGYSASMGFGFWFALLSFIGTTVISFLPDRY